MFLLSATSNQRAAAAAAAAAVAVAAAAAAAAVAAAAAAVAAAAATATAAAYKTVGTFSTHFLCHEARCKLAHLWHNTSAHFILCLNLSFKLKL